MCTTSHCGSCRSSWAYRTYRIHWVYRFNWYCWTSRIRNKYRPNRTYGPNRRIYDRTDRNVRTNGSNWIHRSNGSNGSITSRSNGNVRTNGSNWIHRSNRLCWASWLCGCDGSNGSNGSIWCHGLDGVDGIYRNYGVYRNSW